MASTRLLKAFGSDEEDSISITSSTNDAIEDGQEYPVERILAEREVGGGKEYLVQWEGWPLAEATWEPSSHIEAEEIIAGWHEHQQKVKNGTAVFFDTQIWDDAFLQAEEEREARRERRRAKRKKLGLPVEPRSPVQESSAEMHEPSDSPDSDPMPLRTPAKRRRLTLLDSDDDELPLGARHPRDTRPPRRKQYIAKASQSKTGSPAEKVKPASPKPVNKDLATRRGSSAAKVHNEEPSEDKWNTDPRRTSPPPTRRNSDVPTLPVKSATTASGTVPTANVKRPVNIFATPKKPGKPARRGAKSSTTITRDHPQATKFRNLSTANRYQKFGENRAPDPNSLITIDPATGKAQSAVSAVPRSVPSPAVEGAPRTAVPLVAQTRPRDRPKPLKADQSLSTLNRSTIRSAPQTPIEPQHPSFNALPSAYGRRSPKVARRERTPSPPRPPPIYAVPPDLPDVRNKKNFTCYFWRANGFCVKRDGECDFAHGPAPYRCFKPGEWTPDAIQREVALYMERRKQEQMRDVQGTAYVQSQASTTLSRSRTLALNTTAQTKTSDKPDPLAPNAAPSTVNRHSVNHSDALPVGEIRPIAAQGEVQIVRTDSPQGAPPLASSLRGPSHVVIPAQYAPGSGLDFSAIIMNVEAGTQKFALNVRLVTSSVQGLKSLLQSAGDHFHVNLSFSHMVIAADLEEAYPGFAAKCTTYPGGSIVPDHDSLDKMRQMVCLARHRVAAFVGFYDRFTLFSYAHGGEWKALDDATQPPSGDPSLRFRFGPALDRMPIARGPLLHSLLNLDEARLFPGREGGRRKKRVVMLILPADRQQESLVLAQYLKEIGCEVCHVDAPGAWHHFRGSVDRLHVIILDPDVPLHRIHSLSHFLRDTGQNGAVFSWGVNTRIQRLQHQTPSLSCERLFPRGTVVFITDEVILHHTEQATRLIRWVLQQRAHGKNVLKVATRPGLKDWLVDLVSKPEMMTAPRLQQLAEFYCAICELCPVDAEDPLAPGKPSETADLISERLEEFTNSAWWQVREFAGQDIRSTDYMVEWFAGWSALMASHKYRCFMVAHLEKDPKSIFNQQTRSIEKHFEIDPHGWGSRWQHILVTNPENVFAKGHPKK